MTTKTHAYEITRRGDNEHRPGHFALSIDGLDADLTTDPAQFVKRATRQAVAEGIADPAALAMRMGELCQQAALHALGRVAARLKDGRSGAGVSASSGARRPRRLSEAKAVELFLHRGALKGLTKEARDERRKRRAEKRDVSAEWVASRLKLIESYQAKVAALKAEALAAQKSANPARAHKLERQIAKLENYLADLTSSQVVAASHGFQYAYGQNWTGAIDLVNDDVRAVPVMTSTTVDSERDAKDQVSDFTTLDEFDGANYTTGGIALANQAVNIDDANDRAEFDADDFPAVAASYGAGTRDIEGLLLIVFSVSLSASMPYHWLEPATDWSPDGSAFQWLVNAEGLLNAQDA